MPYRPFNSPLESGLRALFLLAASHPNALHLQRIIFYDYLALHSSDVANGPSSLHPAIPHRGSQWLVRRDSVQRGLAIFLSRELVSLRPADTGFLYTATALTSRFLESFDSDYSRRLKDTSTWVAQHFSDYSDEQLTRFMTDNVGKWGAEFKLESLVRGTPYEL